MKGPSFNAVLETPVDTKVIVKSRSVAQLVKSASNGYLEVLLDMMVFGGWSHDGG